MRLALDVLHQAKVFGNQLLTLISSFLVKELKLPVTSHVAITSVLLEITWIWLVSKLSLTL